MWCQVGGDVVPGRWGCGLFHSPLRKPLILFYYLFLSHQTGWTALAVRCIDKIAERKSMNC